MSRAVNQAEVLFVELRKVVDSILVHLVAKIAARYRLYRLFVHEAACTFLTRPCLFPPFDQGQPHETT